MTSTREGEADGTADELSGNSSRPHSLLANWSKHRNRDSEERLWPYVHQGDKERQGYVDPSPSLTRTSTKQYCRLAAMIRASCSQTTANLPMANESLRLADRCEEEGSPRTL
jgi:hypothetical protein